VQKNDYENATAFSFVAKWVHQQGGEPYENIADA
jgi:hypothetical protein